MIQECHGIVKLEKRADGGILPVGPSLHKLTQLLDQQHLTDSHVFSGHHSGQIEATGHFPALLNSNRFADFLVRLGNSCKFQHSFYALEGILGQLLIGGPMQVTQSIRTGLVPGHVKVKKPRDTEINDGGQLLFLVEGIEGLIEEPPGNDIRLLVKMIVETDHAVEDVSNQDDRYDPEQLDNVDCRLRSPSIHPRLGVAAASGDPPPALADRTIPATALWATSGHPATSHQATWIRFWELL
jgi:hypothetical protein